MPSAAIQQPLAHRFFFALKPDEITARRTRVFAETELGPKGLLEADRHHVTLALTDDFTAVPGTLVEALLRAGELVHSAPFNLVLDQLCGGYGVVTLRPSRSVQALRDLQAGIARSMANEGIPMRHVWQFNPHETLCYRKTTTPFSRPIAPFRWEVNEFVLVHSFIGLHRHEIIGRWPLVETQLALL